jgi:predicted MFS family arabinose efflux permease
VSWVYAREVLHPDPIGFPQNYTILMAAIGLGTLVGGLWVGTLSNRHRKGLLATAGFLVFGLLMAVVGLVTNIFVAAALFFSLGAVNMVFVIPNMTLFQERTPPRLMGRVVSIRMALVFGVMTAAMAGSGLLAGLTDAGVTFAVAGLLCAAAGAAGFLIPAMRDAA